MYAQTVSVPTPKMNVAVVDGEAVIHNLREKKAADVVVLVRDGNRNPIPGAAVTFVLPSEGASAVFPNGQKMLTTTSNNEGYAAARGIRSNNIRGSFIIQIEAKRNNEVATTRLTHFNMEVERSKGGSGKWIAVLGVFGAAAAAGTAVALRSNSSSAASPIPI